MKRTGRDGVYLGAVLLTLTLGCGGDVADALVVQIDDTGVTLGALREIVDFRLEHEGEAQHEEILNQELDRLVNQRVVLNRADALGIEISTEEAADRLRQLHGTEFESDDVVYVEGVRRQMAGERAAIVDLANQVYVPEESIISYFEEHRDDYLRPARIQVRQIVVQDEAEAHRLRDELEGGANFSALAQASSAAPEASAGGLLPPFAKGELPDVFDRAFELDLDEISAVLDSPYGFHIFLLVARFPPQVPELGDVHEKIKAELQTRRLAELKRGWLRDLRRVAEIRVDERLLEQLR